MLSVIFDNLGNVLVGVRVVKNTVCNSPSNRPTKEPISFNFLLRAFTQFFTPLIIEGKVAMFEEVRSEAL
jgi:hypothetical protein